MKVFVGYASRHGATQGIAERIATRLERPGIEVTLRPVDEADSVDEYDAFVIGSAAYMGGWLGQATTFVRQHRELLARCPVWLFSSGPIGSELVDAKGRDQLEASAPKEFAEFSTTIQPRAEQVFFGAYNPDAGPIGMAEGVMARFMRVVPAIRQALPAGDFRDWNAIDAWAETIARDLQHVQGGILTPA
jgi:menaquinone-dependent protoporphyrinogen oxidase